MSDKPNPKSMMLETELSSLKSEISSLHEEIAELKKINVSFNVKFDSLNDVIADLKKERQLLKDAIQKSSK